jgi:hypothetical protein
MKRISTLSIVLLCLCVVSLRGADSPGRASGGKLSTAPKGAIVLFDGTDLGQWVNCHGDKAHWKLTGGAMEVTALKGHSCPRIQGIKTSKLFSDFQLHVEFKTPVGDKVNSGIYLLRRYEVQIINSHGKAIGKSNCGELYKQKPPDRDMCGKPGQWQSYDIMFRSPRFEKGSDGNPKKIENARITVIHNGVAIHNNVIVKSKTGAGFPESPEPGPIMLQDHGSAVQFRNIWIMPAQAAAAPDYKAK